jgi:hypothetical protein
LWTAEQNIKLLSLLHLLHNTKTMLWGETQVHPRRIRAAEEEESVPRQFQEN